MNKNQTKTVGILGGMGPLATALFFRKLIEATPAKKDWDHLHVIIDNDPQIPSRTRHFLYKEDSPVPRMIADCRKLEAYPVDFIVIPCNSASYFLPEIQPHITVPILNIMETTARGLAVNHPGVRRVAVLGGAITYHHRTYQPFLQQLGLIHVQHSQTVQNQVESLIEQIKINDIGPAILQKIKCTITQLQEKDAVEAVILGCTEFGYIAQVESGIPVIDSTHELAKSTVQLARSPAGAGRP
jgi:aspartate racemase